MLRSVNPATGEVMAQFEEASAPEIEAAIERAQEAYGEWRERPLAERRELVRSLAGPLRANKEELARLASLEMGKVIGESLAEVEKAAGFCEYYADQADRFLAPRKIEGGQLENWVWYEPLGAVLAVMPWNFPYVQVFRFAPAMLVAGNVVVLKHASNVPQCALAIQEVFREAGLPDGTFTTLLIGPSAVKGIIADDRIRGVTLTGSEAAGSEVAAAAGRALKPSVLELGGSDPFIVLEDANIADAAAKACISRLSNSGQACINAKRLIVVEEVADEFEQELADQIARLRVGDPLDPETNVGPVSSHAAVDALKGQVEDSVKAGALMPLGGFDRQALGAFVEPILLTSVTAEMRVFREETFGPVAAVVRVPDELAAVELANDSEYGLGASIWTGDLERARRIAARLEAGMVFINEVVVSDARLPFGGTKRSGYGRELGEWGIREFTQIKSVAVNDAPDAEAGADRADSMAIAIE